ncbi:hypothetical protein PISL3812_07783 [Talaromyces islandicus]|uniref:Uncharacterized protein n=1 Tax=Talaromyces islandicus TaxID=28573 RepID=A0A0U1M545_TALIS|nr:hypothetical protein PISL3812_07783 [Talaromyces islandicus]
MSGPTRASNAELLSHYVQKRLRVPPQPSLRHTFDLFTLSPNDSPWSHQAEQLSKSLISILKAHTSDDPSSRIILVTGNVDNPPVLSPLTITIQQLILRKPAAHESEKEPMIWVFCSRYFPNPSHDGPNALVKSLIIQLQHRTFLPAKGFNYEMECTEFDFGLALLKSILSPEQEKLRIDELWIMLDYPTFFFQGQPAEWTGKMGSLFAMLVEAVKDNPALRLVVTDPGKMNEAVHEALSPCVRLSWETGRGKGNGWFDIEEP